MEIIRQALLGVVELRIRGRLDGYWADHLDTTLRQIVREGHDRIRLDLSDVAFISSAAIGVLVKTYKQLLELGGALVVMNPSLAVQTVLQMTRLTSLLVEADGSRSEAATPLRSFDRDGVRFDVFELVRDASLKLTRVGNAEAVTGGATHAQQSKTLACPESVFAFGIGALGGCHSECHDRFGEFVAAAGAAVYQPSDGTEVPDYLVASNTFAPDVQTLYGLSAEGDFTGLLRFDGAGSTGRTTLSALAERCLDLSGKRTAGIAMVAEAASLVGAAMRRSPAVSDTGNRDLFAFPEIRARLSFTTERAFARTIALVVGIVSRHDQADLRPLDAENQLYGHFHAVAFPGGPLRKGRIELKDTVDHLFERSHPQGVLHLLKDDRPVAGVGESEFIRGACWLAPAAHTMIES